MPGSSRASVRWRDRFWAIVAIDPLILLAVGWPTVVERVGYGPTAVAASFVSAAVAEALLRRFGTDVVDPLWRGATVALVVGVAAVATLRLAGFHTDASAWAAQLLAVAVGLFVAARATRTALDRPWTGSEFG